MPDFYAQTTLLALSGETADNQSNIFAFESTGGLDSGSAIAFTNVLTDYYNALRSAGALRGLAQNAHQVKYYAAVTSVPNYPLFTNSFNLSTPPGAIDLPLEVALCVSYANDSETSISAKRRRGRNYVSGWGEGDNTAGRPITGTVTGLLNAYVDYVNDANALSGVTASVWSRANAALYPIERVWVDNEWDTMRSRGGKSTSRETTLIT